MKVSTRFTLTTLLVLINQLISSTCDDSQAVSVKSEHKGAQSNSLFLFLSSETAIDELINEFSHHILHNQTVSRYLEAIRIIRHECNPNFLDLAFHFFKLERSIISAQRTYNNSLMVTKFELNAIVEGIVKNQELLKNTYRKCNHPLQSLLNDTRLSEGLKTSDQRNADIAFNQTRLKEKCDSSIKSELRTTFTILKAVESKISAANEAVEFFKSPIEGGLSSASEILVEAYEAKNITFDPLDIHESDKIVSVIKKSYRNQINDTVEERAINLVAELGIETLINVPKNIIAQHEEVKLKFAESLQIATLKNEVKTSNKQIDQLKKEIKEYQIGYSKIDYIIHLLKSLFGVSDNLTDVISQKEFDDKTTKLEELEKIRYSLNLNIQTNEKVEKRAFSLYKEWQSKLSSFVHNYAMNHSRNKLEHIIKTYRDLTLNVFDGRFRDSS